MQFRLLGSVDVEADGECLPLPRRRTRCLLAILLLDVNRIVPVARLAQLLWEDDPPPRARADIQGHVSRLRNLLTTGHDHPPTLVFASDGYQLTAEPLAIDAHRFRDLLQQAATSTDLTSRIDHLRTAIGLWRGPALGNAASSWLRERLCADLEEQRLTATEDLISAYLATDRVREALPMLAATAAAHHQRESLIALHMRALYQVGRKAEALDVYTRARAQLSDQLGLDPGPNLRNLHQAILRDELPLAVPAEPIRVAAPPGGPPGPPNSTVVPRQLPADVAGFTGRAAELARLDSILHGATGSPASVLVCTIGGAAGVGKTALAVHWAHRVLDTFPDGQLYLDLRGFDLSRPPLTPAAAVRAFLDALRVPALQLPTSLEAQIGLYRSLLAGQRTLIVLDNARDAEQVRPLLPGTPGTLVLVTSRNQLTSLIATEGANPVNVGLLTPDEARELVARRIGAARVTAEPAATNEIVRRCARLPLALAVVAARAAIHPHLRLQTLAEELRNPGTRLDALATPGTSTDVRAVFSWSYHALSAEAARLFRLLGLHPGPDVTVPAAASLAGVPVPQARRNLAELAAASLVIEHAGGRFACHDLLRTYANELARTRDPDLDRRQALRRLLDHYLRTTDAATSALIPHRVPVTLPPALPGADPEPVTAERSLPWLVSERAVLVNAVALAARCGLDSHAWQLAFVLYPFLDSRGYWHDATATLQLALAAAKRVADPTAQTHIHWYHGRSLARQGECDAARQHLLRALDMFTGVGDHHRQAAVHLVLGALSESQGRDPREALDHAHEALKLNRVAGHLVGQARALNAVAWSYVRLGDPEASLETCRQALAVHQRVDDPSGAANAWDTAGLAHFHLGDHREAITCLERAMELYDRSEDRLGRAETLHRLGDAYLAIKDSVAAHAAWEHAAAIFHELGDGRAEEVRGKLHHRVGGRATGAG